jgi:RHS repeat-associated protein
LYLSGYERSVSATDLPAGVYTLIVIAHSSVSGAYQAAPAARVYVDMPDQTLTVTMSGTGQGTVTSDTGGITCTGPATPGGTCQATFAYAAPVILTATPATGTTFLGWTPGTGTDCIDTAPCAVTLDEAVSVTARFFAPPPTVTTYYHLDAIGSVRVVTDINKNEVARHDYAPFGEDNTDPAGDPRRFTGKELDSETALHYFGARYYRNLLGRFTTVDPVNGDALDPQSWNPYAYVLNNPLRYFDPDGRQVYPGYRYREDWVVPAGSDPFASSVSGEYLRMLPIDRPNASPFAILRALERAGRMAEVGVAPAIGLLEAFGWMVAPPAMAIAQCAAGGGCAQSALAMVPFGRIVRLPPGTAQHIFRGAAGHVNPSSAASKARFMRLFEAVAASPGNRRPNFPLPPGATQAGVEVYTQTFRNGEVWVFVRNGQIINAGVNRVGGTR